MRESQLLSFLIGFLASSCIFSINAESPYKYYEWEITYGTISPLGVPQRGILINGQFPGPPIDADTNDNVIVTIANKLDEPFLMTWNGVHQRKTSWQDGVEGTNCPIPPKTSWTYKTQMKDQIGSFYYFPSMFMQRAAGGYGALNLHRRPMITIPYPEPDAEFALLVGDWYLTDHKELKKQLDAGYNDMRSPDGLLINGNPNGTVITGELGKTYLIRVSNVGIMTSINFRIEGHKMKLVEVEGSHVLQEMYESLDLHPGQSMAFLVTLQEVIKDYYIVASTRFATKSLDALAILHYVGSNTIVSGPLPSSPPDDFNWSREQARTIRMNLTANAARPNPQGSYHYGKINITKTLILANSKGEINGKLRYGANKISYVNPETPLKLADYYNITGVFNLTSVDDPMPENNMIYGTLVYNLTLHDFVEIIFQNNENSLQSWHLDGKSFFVVAYGENQWSTEKRSEYNLIEAPARSTVQVYPYSWTTALASLDNKGMWNLRSAIWHRRYLGQEVYLRIWNDETSLLRENKIPSSALKCGKAADL